MKMFNFVYSGWFRSLGLLFSTIFAGIMISSVFIPEVIFPKNNRIIIFYLFFVSLFFIIHFLYSLKNEGFMQFYNSIVFMLAVIFLYGIISLIINLLSKTGNPFPVIVIGVVLLLGQLFVYDLSAPYKKD